MIASGTAVLLVAAGFVTYELVTRRQNLARDLSTLAEVIGNESTAALDFEDEDRAKEILTALRAKRNVVAAALYKPSGELLSAYSPNAFRPETVPVRPE